MIMHEILTKNMEWALETNGVPGKYTGHKSCIMHKILTKNMEVALKTNGVPGKDTGHKSSLGMYHHRHYKYNFTSANACS